MKLILLNFLLAFSSFAAIKDSIYLQGVVTNSYQDGKYISVRDVFDQEYVLPKKLLEIKTGRKVAGSTNREFKGSLYFF